MDGPILFNAFGYFLNRRIGKRYAVEDLLRLGIHKIRPDPISAKENIPRIIE
tara:strand:- start:2454 stop:2609 length:156 start_codon:yes stop_codon:yes gene_type:complete